MIPNFLLSLKSCPSCQLKCDCFPPFNIVFYNGLQEIDFRISFDIIISFNLKNNITYMIDTNEYHETNLFQNASSIQDIVLIYNKLQIFQ